MRTPGSFGRMARSNGATGCRSLTPQLQPPPHLLSSRCRETVLSVPPLRIYRSSCLSYSLRLFPLLLRVFSLPPPPLGLISFHARQEWLSPWKMSWTLSVIFLTNTDGSSLSSFFERKFQKKKSLD